MPFTVNLYDPNGPGYAPRIKNEDWEKHRAVISRLHANQTPRKAMIKRLRDECDFRVTIGQLQAKCKEWDLKVYSKEDASHCGRPPTKRASASSHKARQPQESKISAFHIATESNFVQEWADDFRVHHVATLPFTSLANIEPLHNQDDPFQDRSLPPEYIGGGLLANTADSHWPVPQDDQQCEAMLQAAHYYYAVHAFQQSFSIYRAVYKYQRCHLSLSDPQLVATILQSSCAAVTDHQRNIMHSVLLEIGTSDDIDRLEPLLMDCLQSAALNMVSSDATCDVDGPEQVRARAAAYLYIINALEAKNTSSPQIDVQALLYNFEHSLLMQEHELKILQSLFNWCETAVDHLQRDLDDIFIGHASSEEEYYRKIAQVLSGHLLSQWYRQPEDHIEVELKSSGPFTFDPCSFQFQITRTQALVALAFMVVDAVRCDPLVSPFSERINSPSSLWFLDAARFFKRGCRMLKKLDERSRCIAFSEVFLERFYTSVSIRQKTYHYTTQLPAIVDSIGMSLAQQREWMVGEEEASRNSLELLEEDVMPSIDASVLANPIDFTNFECSALNNNSNNSTHIEAAPSPMSECTSIASFLNTYQRILKSKLGPSSKSGRSTPGDVMSFSSSAEFKFGIVTNASASADVDSLWQVISSG